MPFKNKKTSREYHRKWSKKNATRRHELNNAWRNKQIERFQEFKATLKCELCPETEPCCLQFHHRDPKKKDIEVSVAASRWSWERLMKEINKCAVLCANCHTKVHAGVCQSVDSHSCKVEVTGSSPVSSSRFRRYDDYWIVPRSKTSDRP